MKKKKILILSIITIMFIFTALVSATETSADLFDEVDPNNNLRLGNDYIVIVVNQNDNALGRFAIETTGGAPLEESDDNKPLVYGRPRPWTSYTTLWLDGQHYVFGGQTGRRAGSNGNYGEVVQGPYVDNNSIVTTTQFEDDIIVEQILTIVKSYTTGLYDSVQIKYRVENTGDKDHKVGLRVVLDTMLGQNDGAPFRIGNDAVVSDKLYYSKELPQFWQAFDSISDPTVTSQGTFTGTGVTTPDQVKFADWGSMADGVWDFDFNPGEDFLRKGEYEIDSAAALYWVPETLEAGESRSYITNYGLGGITVVPGLLSLGITSPAEVVLDTPDKTIPIVAYVENTSEIVAEGVSINIQLPEILNTDNMTKELGDLEPGEIAQVVWNVLPEGINMPPDINYTVMVEADNTDSNQVTRNMRFIGPPNLESTVSLGEEPVVENGRLVPNPFTIITELYNSGGSPLYDTSIELLLPPGLILAPKEISKKYPGDIQAGERINIKWRVKALNIDGQLPVAIDIQALHGYQEVKTYDNLILPQLDPLIYFNIKDEGDYQPGDYITIDLIGENLYGIELIDLNINYDSQALKPVFVSRGTIFIKDDENNTFYPWTRPDISNAGEILIDQIIPTEKTRGIIASIHFKVLDPENLYLEWNDNTEFIGESEDLSVKLINLNK
ncbi:MAG: hypothetical protein ACLFPF_07620 [Halanaerobiales bacterium]